MGGFSRHTVCYLDKAEEKDEEKEEERTYKTHTGHTQSKNECNKNGTKMYMDFMLINPYCV